MTPDDVKEFRRKANISQKKLGEKLGYAYPQIYISKIERGKIAITSRFEAQINILKENLTLQK